MNPSLLPADKRLSIGFHPVKWISIHSLICCLFGIWSLTLRAAEPLRVLAAASLTESLQAIGIDFEKASGIRVQFQFGASSTLARQIEEGAPADVFFSADEAKMDQLEKSQKVVAGTRWSPLSNQLVVVGDIQTHETWNSISELTSISIEKIALADPKTVPAGIYAKSYLQKAGVWSKIESKVVPTENVRAALAAVESGNAQAALVYKTDAQISKKVRVLYSVGWKEGPSIRYSVAQLRESTQPRSAALFLEHLRSRGSSAIFENQGFIVLPQTTNSGSSLK